MKLQIVPASRGSQWVKLGMRTFFKQPLALAGLFFMFMATMSILNMVPFIGSALALAFLPAATLGLMAASQQATEGKFPMPLVLFSAFRAGRPQAQAMLVLGALYALGFLGTMGLTALVDGGELAKLYLFGGAFDAETLQEPTFQFALLLFLALYLPLTLMFWHAPALVHWHGVSPVKSLFFSLVACFRNFWTYTVFGLVWMATFLAVGMLVATLGALWGSADATAALMFPAIMLIAAMFFTSLYFTYSDSFDLSSNGDNP